ncbi:MAG: pyridoxal phosphate-dependent aminotransferase [Anaerolineales bacterium]
MLKRDTSNKSAYPEKKIRGHLNYRRSAIEIESPEQYGYDKIKYNLTESSVPDAIWSEIGCQIDDLIFCYTDHLGNPELREIITADKEHISKDNVLISIGAASALFIVNTCLLRQGTHAVVLHPNYVTNIETPRAIGANIDFLSLEFEENWEIDLDKLESLIKPHTKLISLTSPHNPTGMIINENDLEGIIHLAETHECMLVFDETYRDMAQEHLPPLAASLSPNVISVSSLSKSYGLPGIRIGWLICQNDSLMETFLAAKEQIFICGSVIDEELAKQYLFNKQDHLSKIISHINKNLKILNSWIEENPYFEWVAPKGGVVCFPRLKENPGMDIEAFYKVLNDEYQTFVGPGHWFEMDRRYMRIGFGWPTSEDLKNGLKCLNLAAEASIIKE